MRLAVVLLLLSSPALAQVEDPDVEIARRHFEKGREHYGARDYVAALREFEEARKFRPAPGLDYNIGRCLDRMERFEEAIAAYQRYLSAVPDAADAPEVRQRVAVLRARVPENAPLPPESSTPAVQEPPPAPSLSTPAPSRRRFLAPALVGVGALALAIAGAALLGTVAGDYQQLDGPNGCRPCSDAQIDPLQTRANAGYGLLGAAGAVAVVDIGLWIWAARKR